MDVKDGIYQDSVPLIESVFQRYDSIRSVNEEYYTPDKLCRTNGKLFPVLAVKGGIYYIFHPHSSIVQWVNCELIDCSEGEYQSQITNNLKVYQEYTQERLRNISKPTCPYCRKEFNTIDGFHKHRRKCDSKQH
ncbi:hypothetical protein [Niallia taxi]|uniref:hypothetical protein n=1 Tax=Niallia taxi TaxID=2499688 RepID=UPI0015F5ABFF|nr:hypothetical protein [Niallia taxi]